MPCVFLSHSSDDKQYVRRIAEDLNKAGIDVWLDEAEIHVGDSLIHKIGEALHAVDYVAAFISKNSILSQWVRKELSLAMTKEIKGKRITVLPILIESCDIPFFLSDKLYADFTTPEKYEQNFTKLVESIRHASIVTDPADIKLNTELSTSNPISAKHLSIGSQPLGSDRTKEVFYGIKTAKNSKQVGAAMTLAGLSAILLVAILADRITSQTKPFIFLTFLCGALSGVSGVFRIMSGICFSSAFDHDVNLLIAIEDIKGYSFPFNRTWQKQYRVGKHNRHHCLGLIIETTSVVLMYTSSVVLLSAVILAIRWAAIYGV